jgi:molybdopterin molybdotransferase
MMDGYALRLADWRMGTRQFRVTAAAAAGQPACALHPAPATCVEVMTGAPLPAGADLIVPVEETSPLSPGLILVSPADGPVSGRHIHRAGRDTQAGETVLAPGIMLGSRHLGAAASCGAAWLMVSCLPRIAIFATGDELVPVDASPLPHQIRQSNAQSIRAALQHAGYPAAAVGTLPDEPETTAASLTAALALNDWLILTGGISKGARDFIPGILDRLGCRRLFHGVAQRPGKPAGCWLGPAGQVIAALPGNPVSAITGLHALVLPALAAASKLKPRPPRHLAPAAPLTRLPAFTHHLPVRIEDDLAHPAPADNSGDFIGLLSSDGFLTLPPATEPAGTFPFTPWL